MAIDLRLGDYLIRIEEPEDLTRLIWPLRPFDAFLCETEERPDIHVVVHVVEHLPDLPHDGLVFDACHGLWRLYSTASGARPGWLLEGLDTKTFAPRSRSLITPDYDRIEVWLLGQRRRRKLAWFPMHVINPVVEMCLVTRLAREGGLLLHAMGSLFEAEGWVFTGASGSGKSTLSDIFATRGSTILSDERVIIRQIGDQFWVFGTPWVGAGRYASDRAGLLTRLFCIRHGSGAHALRPMTPRGLAQFLFPQLFLPHWDRAAMAGTLSTMAKLVDLTESFELAFVKDPDVVDFLRNLPLGDPVGTA